MCSDLGKGQSCTLFKPKPHIMKFAKLVFLLVLGLGIISCNIDSKSSEDSSEQTMEKNDGDINLDNVEADLNKAKDALNDLFSDGKKDGEKVEVINWRELKEFLPNRLDGNRLDEENIEGSTTGMMGFTVSQVEGTYKDNDSRFDVNVIDFGGVSFLVKTLANWADANIDSDTSEGYQRTTEYKGYKAFEEYSERSKSGSFSILVENRFMVNIKGDNVSMDDLKDAIDDLNIKKLARMAG